MPVDREKFTIIADKMDAGEVLTFSDLGDIFGNAFWEPLVFALMDAGDAARAIQGAIGRLKEASKQKAKINH